MPLQTTLLSSLHKVFPHRVPQANFSAATLLQNEPFSFQIAYKSSLKKQALYIEVQSTLTPISQYRVDYVPLLCGENPGSDGGEDETAPGLFPDILRPRQTNAPLVEEGYFWDNQVYEANEPNLIYGVPNCWQALWFTVNEAGTTLLPPGRHTVTVRFCCPKTREVLSSQTLNLTVLPAVLPTQTLLYTNWLHCDCLADLHGVEIFSDRFFAILKNYLTKAVQNGMNMLLLPAFTPPLDTPVGKTRKTAQLVQVARRNGDYSFDFSLLKRYMEVALSAGITHFEHCHLFTQWGAKAAPKIMATENGIYRQIFGWETPANSPEYTAFLAAYLPALRRFLKPLKLDNKILYHVSDEPNETMLQNYKTARDTVTPYLKGCMMGDALSNYSYYEQGLVQTPIVATNHLKPFLGHCENLWCYYTAEQVMDGVSNRLLNFPAARNRVLGFQLYRHRIKGFLHWGYNYYYGILSHGVSDPAVNPNVFGMDPGSGYLVYPDRANGCLQSMRQKVLGEGLQDMRAMQLLEQLIGREAACRVLDTAFGQPVDFHTCPATAEALLKVRETVNAAIAENLAAKTV